MASLTLWTWVWVISRSCGWTGKPGMLKFMGLQIFHHTWANELNWLLQSVFPINKNHKVGAVDISIQAVLWTNLYDIQAKFFGDSQMNFYYSSRMGLGKKIYMHQHFIYDKGGIIFFFYLISSSFISVSSVAQSCLTLCDPMDCSTSGFPVYHLLLEPTQTCVHEVGDTIQPSHPRLSPSPDFSFSQHQGLFKWVS